MKNGTLYDDLYVCLQRVANETMSTTLYQVQEGKEDFPMIFVAFCF